MLALNHGQAEYLGKVLGAVGSGIVSRAPTVAADRAPFDIEQAIAHIVLQREVRTGAPA